MTRIVARKNLAALKADAARRVDSAAEAVRQQYITPGSGQAMVYQAKQEEARRFLAEAPGGDLSAFPLISAEIGITAASASEIANLWLAMETMWRTAAAAIERKRLSAKKAIEAAISPAEISAAEQVDWSAP